MMAPNQRFSQGLHKPLQLLQSWRDNNISVGSKMKLMCSLVISIFLYTCESWTLTAELEKRTQAFEMRSYRRLLNISYMDHVTNEEVRRKIQAAIGEYDEFLTLVKKQKLRWFGHVSRSSGLAKTILQGTAYLSILPHKSGISRFSDHFLISRSYFKYKPTLTLFGPSPDFYVHHLMKNRGDFYHLFLRVFTVFQVRLDSRISNQFWKFSPMVCCHYHR